MDLVSQIGLDPNEPNMALFQCFYRWGQLPVLEVVFLLRKKHVEKDRLIVFDTAYGMPASGDVQFIEDEGGNSTTVMFKFEHQLPNLLVDLSVRTFGVEAHCREIFRENLQAFKELAEAIARNPSTAPPRTVGLDEEIEVGLPGYERPRPPAPEGWEGEEDDEGEDGEEHGGSGGVVDVGLQGDGPEEAEWNGEEDEDQAPPPPPPPPKAPAPKARGRPRKGSAAAASSAKS
ncbi:hypothetical protein FOA52_011022 [Chlamydomonas sp. UWO 241]|nr:hypothetical protein FOA52_011022 [Chlamydomonas sp. UWO 241]